MVHFVGAGPGAPDLITVRGQRLLEAADVILYAGSLVNPEVLEGRKPSCRIYDTARMTLEEVLEVIRKAEEEGGQTVRLHTGDPCLYGAIREQMDALEREGIDFDMCPGVSAFGGAAAALNLEYTLPDGRPDAGAGAGKAVFPGVPPDEYGAVFKHRPSKGRGERAAGRRISRRYAGGYCIQGHLERGKKGALYRGHAGRDSRRDGGKKHGPDSHRPGTGSGGL